MLKAQGRSRDLENSEDMEEETWEKTKVVKKKNTGGAGVHREKSVRFTEATADKRDEDKVLPKDN